MSNPGISSSRNSSRGSWSHPPGMWGQQRWMRSATGTETLQPLVQDKQDSHYFKSLDVPRRHSFGTASNAPGNRQTSDIVGPIHKIGSLNEYYDVSAFAPVNTPRFGTGGRNILTGPGIINNDLSLFRDFSITERLKLTFKAEAFNV